LFTVTVTLWVPRGDVTTTEPDELLEPAVTVTIAGVVPVVGNTVKFPNVCVLKDPPLPFTINVCAWVDPEGRLKTRDTGLATGPVTADPPMTIETLIVWVLLPVENRPVVEIEIAPVQVPAARTPGVTLTLRAVAVDESCPVFGVTCNHP
jgi:hypothetical protein